jgi:hypothetical protein
MRRELPSISWRVQAQWRNRFRFGNNPEADFSTKIGDGLILIRIQKMGVASYFGARLASKNL